MEIQDKTLESSCDKFFDLPKEKSVADYLLRKCQSFSSIGHPCITNPTNGIKIHYKEVESLSAKIASYLQQNGLEAGDIIINASHHATLLHVFFIGVWRLGGIVRCSYPEDIGDVLVSRIIEPRVKFLLCDENTRGDFLQAAAIAATASGGNSEVKVIVFGEKALKDNCISIHDILDESSTDIECDFGYKVEREDVALLLPTSGTTGESKAVVYTHQVLMKNILLFQHFPFTNDPNSPSLVTGKQTHFTGCVSPLAFMAAGRYVLMMRDVNQENILNAVHAYRVKSIFSFPKFLTGLVSSPSASQFDLSSLEFVFTAGMIVGPSFFKTVKSLPNVKSVDTIYGMTETGFLASTVTWATKDGEIQSYIDPSTNIGMEVSPGSRLQVRDVDTGKVLGRSQKGELCFQSELASPGYWKNPQASAVTFRDGWVHTGDLGYVDNNGKIHVLNRIKDVFKYYNNHVTPSEIENVILEHPSVVEAVVVGIPDPNGGDTIPRAFVTIKDSYCPDKTCSKILQFTNKNLASYKKLRGGLFIIPELPRTVTGKVQKNSLLTLPQHNSPSFSFAFPS